MPIDEKEEHGAGAAFATWRDEFDQDNGRASREIDYHLANRYPGLTPEERTALTANIICWISYRCGRAFVAGRDFQRRWLAEANKPDQD